MNLTLHGARGAASSAWRWTTEPGKGRWKFLLIGLVAALLAFGGWADGCRERARADRILEDAAKETAKLKAEIAGRDAQWAADNAAIQERLAAAEAASARSLDRMDMARRARDARWTPPVDLAETVKRFGRLGYEGRVR